MHTKEYNWNAADYAANSTTQTSWAHELIKKLSLQGHEKVLDIGCGNGKITNAIAGKLCTGKAVGIDKSANMISLATRQFDRQNLSFYVMDATELSLLEKFDIAFSNAALHWVKNHKSVLLHLKKILHQKSRILFQMGGHGNAEDIVNIVTKATQLKHWEKYFENFVSPYNFYEIQDYEKWLQQTGYKAKRIELIPKDMVHEKSNGLQGWLRTTWFPYTDQLPDTEKEHFLAYVVNQYTTSFPADSNGKIHVKMVRLEVEASPA
jgi:trans-aconitate methyltransferase